MTPNGLVLFQGGKNPFRAGPGAVLTALIDGLTHCNDSHAGMAIDGRLYESTIENGISGPQANDLDARVAAYHRQGGHAHLLRFLPAFEPDWGAMLAGAQHMIALRIAGKMPYNVKRLFGDAIQRSLIFDLVCLPADGILAYMAAHSIGVVCSEMAAFLIQYGGSAAKLTARGLRWLPQQNAQPIGCSPLDLANAPMWQAPVAL